MDKTNVLSMPISTMEVTALRQDQQVQTIDFVLLDQFPRLGWHP